MSVKSRTVYLDNAATSFPKPKQVTAAVTRTMTSTGNPGRGGHAMAVGAARLVFNARVKIAEFFRLANPERLVFTRGATEGINIALKGLLKRGDIVAVSALEHNAVARPLESLRKQGVIIERAPLLPDGLPDHRRVPGVKMLVTVGASNVTGAIAGVKRLGEACRKQGVIFMVDAAQTAGAVPFDARHVDILACAGHKGLLGPQGTGFVWFREGIEPAPFIEGGTGSESERVSMPQLWPDRMEAGTLNTPGIAGLAAGIGWLEKETVDSVREREISLCRMILDALLNEPEVAVYGPAGAKKRASLVTFNIARCDPAEVAEELNRRGVAVRAGLHCAPSAHRFIGTYPEGAVRVSPGAMNTRRDIAKFISIIRGIIKKR